jgi:hypothetical protein
VHIQKDAGRCSNVAVPLHHVRLEEPSPVADFNLAGSVGD